MATVFFNIINFRIFGIFNHKELDSRFIKTNILKIYKNEEPIIHENKYMDYIYMDDFLQVLKYYLNIEKPKYKDINICYEKKYKLTDLINLIYLNLNKKQIANKNLINGLTNNLEQQVQQTTKLKEALDKKVDVEEFKS